MYKIIDGKPNVLAQYKEKLIKEGMVTQDDIEVSAHFFTRTAHYVH